MTLFVVIAVAGCSLQPAATPTAVKTGGTWTAVEVAGLKPDPLHRIQVQFTVGGVIQGVTGCDEFEATVQIAGEHIALGPIRRHDFAACPADVREIDAAFVTALQSAQRIRGGAGQLVLDGPDGEIRLVQPAP